LLTPGNNEPSDLCRGSITLGKERTVCTEIRITDPSIGPTIVPKPPITLMISGENEFAGEKIELSTYLMK
jgi:hypothetical protein